MVINDAADSLGIAVKEMGFVLNQSLISELE